MSSLTDKPALNHQQLGKQTTRILNSNSFHFILISLLFLPFTFLVSTTIQFYYSSYDITKFDPFNVIIINTIIANSQNILSLKSLIIVIAFIFLVILPTVTGVALITYITNQAIHFKRLTSSSAFKTLSHAYINLLSTFISGSIILILLFFLITLSPIVISKAANVAFGLNKFILSIFINQIASYVVVFTIGFFIVIWASAPSIAVLESKSGYESLRQSAKQSKQFRKHSFSILFSPAFLIFTSFSALAQNRSTNWIFILQVCTCTTYLLCSLTIVYYLVANTVLYAQCKATTRDEDITKTTVDGDDEYVRVAVNDKDDEVSREPAMENANYGGFVYMFCLLSIVMSILFVFMLSQHA